MKRTALSIDDAKQEIVLGKNNPNDLNAPKFDTGTKVFRLSSSSTNSQIAGNVITDATEEFESTGTLQTLQESIVTIRNIRTHTQTATQSKSISGGGGTTINSSTTVTETRTRNEDSGYQIPVAPIRGCTDPTANNYVAAAAEDDGSCEYDPSIPTDCPDGYHWDDMAQRCIQSGTPIIVGCMDPRATNYNPDATHQGQCDYPQAEIVGCMDSGAQNYNPNATKPGPCSWPQDHGMITDTVSSTTKAAIAHY